MGAPKVFTFTADVRGWQSRVHKRSYVVKLLTFVSYYVKDAIVFFYRESHDAFIIYRDLINSR